jgi:hypothetical protein
MQQTSSQTTLVDCNTVYNNVCLVIKTSKQSYLSIAAWCGDTGLITVGCGECRPWGLPHGPVLFAPGFISCLLSRTSP